MATLFPFAGSSRGAALAHMDKAALAPMDKRVNMRLSRFAHNLRRWVDLVCFFAHNSLKSPDSEK